MDRRLSESLERIAESPWTAGGVGAAQSRVAADLRTITETLVGRFAPRAVILSGSLGKREASLVETAGQLHYLSDCEIALVRRWPIPRGKLRACAAELSERTGLDVGLYYNPPQKYTSRLWRGLFFRAAHPSIAIIDRRYSTVCLHGVDYVARLPELDAARIEPWEGVRLIFNRIAQALCQHQPDRPDDGDELWRRTRAYMIHRIAIACGDALLVCARRYDPSYAVRAVRLAELANESQGDLSALAGRWRDELAGAYRAKLLPAAGRVEPLGWLWNRTRSLCDEVLRGVLAREFDVRFDTYAGFPRAYLAARRIVETCYRPPGRWWVNRANRRRIARLRGWGRPTRRAWSHELFATIPPAYFADADPSAAEVVSRRIREVFGLSPRRDGDDSPARRVGMLWKSLIV